MPAAGQMSTTCYTLGVQFCDPLASLDLCTSIHSGIPQEWSLKAEESDYSICTGRAWEQFKNIEKLSFFQVHCDNR